MYSRRLPSIATCCFATLFAIQIFVGSASAQHFQFFAFGGPKGVGPGGGIVPDANGNFYGTTSFGGSGNRGVVYEMSPGPNGRAVQTVLYNFTGDGSNGDGAEPIGDLVIDQAGNLYGVTQFGGNTGNPGSLCDAIGCGTVFELSPPIVQGGSWTETILYSFQGVASDGDQPMAGLVMDPNGNLYGTTQLGGVAGPNCDGGCGALFELSPPSLPGGAWNETILYFFLGSPDGFAPQGALIFDQTGNLYGTTTSGGAGPTSGGTIFELSPPLEQGGAWSETVLHSLAADDGGGPVAGLALGPSGSLYGTTSCCGQTDEGTVFRLLPPSQSGGTWTFEVISNLFSASRAPVTIANAHTLYGIRGNGDGTVVFRISDVMGSVTVTNYPLRDGDGSGSHLTLYNGALYGTTNGGGFKNSGIVFQIKP